MSKEVGTGPLFRTDRSRLRWRPMRVTVEVTGPARLPQSSPFDKSSTEKYFSEAKSSLGRDVNTDAIGERSGSGKMEAAGPFHELHTKVLCSWRGANGDK